MVKLTHQWEGPPDHHEGYPSKSHQSAVALRARHSGPQCRASKAYPSGCKARTPQGLKKGSKKASPHRLY